MAGLLSLELESICEGFFVSANKVSQVLSKDVLVGAWNGNNSMRDLNLYKDLPILSIHGSM
jgi:hypothetical protein